jgi:hypothetical protein
MQGIQWLARPWWVNLLILVPIVVYGSWRGRGLRLRRTQLLFGAIFAAAFGFVEAAVVVYLRAAIGLLPGFNGTLADVARHANDALVSAQTATLPPSLLVVETSREAATMIMLIAVAMLAATRVRERAAMFLWCFAAWDLSYYAGLWATIRWPASLLDSDVLFLIPEPWLSQVWYPLVISTLTMLAVFLASRRYHHMVLEPDRGSAPLDLSTQRAGA